MTDKKDSTQPKRVTRQDQLEQCSNFSMNGKLFLARDSLMESDEYTCYLCKETFTKIRSDKELRAEMLEIFPESEFMKDDEIEVICHDCNIEFMKWWNWVEEGWFVIL